MVESARPVSLSHCGCIQYACYSGGQRISDLCGFQKGVYRCASDLLYHMTYVWSIKLMTFAITEESLLVIRGLGIQTSTSSNTYLSKATTRFIPTTQIQDIVIHEAFKGFEVRFYLAVIVEGEQNVVVVFPVRKS